MSKLAYSLQRLAAWDESWCLRFNRASRSTALCGFLRWVSRLGDGVFWYGLMLGLLIFDGQTALLPVLKMILAGGSGTLVYKMLKRRLLRPRPYQVNQEISLGVAPLDQFSFPSGHTLHAVAFTLVALSYYPLLAWLLMLWVYPLFSLLALMLTVRILSRVTLILLTRNFLLLSAHQKVFTGCKAA